METTRSDLDKPGVQESVRDVDTAFGVFEEVREGLAIDNVDDRSLLWKIDLRLMPLMCVVTHERMDCF